MKRAFALIIAGLLLVGCQTPPMPDLPPTKPLVLELTEGEIAWGEPVNGLQMGLSQKTDGNVRWTYAHLRYTTKAIDWSRAVIPPDSYIYGTGVVRLECEDAGGRQCDFPLWTSQDAPTGYQCTRVWLADGEEGTKISLGGMSRVYSRDDKNPRVGTVTVIYHNIKPFDPKGLPVWTGEVRSGPVSLVIQRLQ